VSSRTPLSDFAYNSGFGLVILNWCVEEAGTFQENPAEDIGL
jgi:hypothetical protein